MGVTRVTINSYNNQPVVENGSSTPKEEEE